MNACVTKGCKGLTGLICNRGWFHYCPVCGAVSPAPSPRTPDKSDRLAADGFNRMQEGRFSEAENLFLSAAAGTADPDRRIFCLWVSLLCRYGVGYVEEVLFASIPARRTSLFLPTFGRFPLPDTDIRAAQACRELEKLLKQRPSSGLEALLDELALLLGEIRTCMASSDGRNDVFIAWHDRPEGGPCASFADRLNSQLALSKECYSFVSFRDLRQHSVDHYEPHIYAALAAARVMVIVIDDYDALGQKFLQSEVQRFLHRKKQDSRLRLYFCGMKGHTGQIPAYLKEQGLECHREDGEDSDLCAQLVRNEVLAILKEQRTAQPPADNAAPGQPPVASIPMQTGRELPKPASTPQTAAGAGRASAPQPGAAASPDAIPAALTEGLARVQFDMASNRWDKALERLGDLQEQYPTRSDPYLYMLLCQHKCHQTAGLAQLTEAFEDTVHWRFALQYAAPAQKQELEKLLADSKALRLRREQERRRVEQERLATERRVAEELRRQGEEALRQEEERRRREQEKKRIAAEKRKEKEAAMAAEKRRQDGINQPLKPFGLYCEFTADTVTLKRLSDFAGSTRRMTTQDPRQREEMLMRRKHAAEILIPDCVTHIGYRAFVDCASLKSVSIPEGVVSIGEDAFAGCSSLTSVTLPGSLREIDEYAFLGCASLREALLPGRLETLGMGAFADCTALVRVTLPGTLREIDEEAFGGCTSLETVIIEEGVKAIYNRAFADCSTRQCIQPKMIYVPASVTAISRDAFARSGFAPFARKGVALVEEGSYAEEYFRNQPYAVRYAEHPEADDEPVPEVALLRSRTAQTSGAKKRPIRKAYADWEEFDDSAE